MRKLLFVLQTRWYSSELIPSVIQVIKTAAKAHFSSDDTIKPIVSYLAANLQEGTSEDAQVRANTEMLLVMAGSPRSVISRIDYSHHREKAEMMLEALVALLGNQALYTKFAAALPLTRICLLFLGEHPSSIVATQVLLLIGSSLRLSSAFGRKFELVNGWTTLQTVVPSAWDPAVHEAAFDILLGRSSSTTEKSATRSETLTIACSHIFPVILAALHRGLGEVARRTSTTFLDVVHITDSTLVMICLGWRH